MKKFAALFLVLFLAVSLNAQDEVKGRTLPRIDIKTLNGEVFNTSEITNDGKPMIVSFFALWCKPCIKELTAISDVYEDWQEETGVKLVAISIDDARSMPNVAPFVNGNDWDFEFYCDPNGDMKRAMGVNMIPHVYLLNGKGEVVYQHTSYAEGSEEALYDLIVKIANGEDISEEH